LRPTFPFLAIEDSRRAGEEEIMGEEERQIDP